MKIFYPLLAFIGVASGLYAQQLRVEKLQTIGDLKHPVVFQSQDLRPLKSSRNLLQGQVVSRWGLHVFELGMLTYDCKVGDCRAVGYQRIATFESCTTKGNMRFACSRRLSGSDSKFSETPNFRAQDLLISNSVDGVEDNYNRPGNGMDDTDFPVRSNGDTIDSYPTVNF